MAVSQFPMKRPVGSVGQGELCSLPPERGPRSPDPAAGASWLQALGLAGPAWCQKPACPLSLDVGFTSQVLPEFTKIPFVASCP